MTTSEINWGDDIIDSREIIDRHEELMSETETLQITVDELKAEIEELAECNNSSHSFDKLISLNARLEVAESTLAAFEEEYGDEMVILDDVIRQGEDSPDWVSGEALIHEDNFEDYTRDLINDCYELPEEFDSGKWPWCHMSMDWSAAADQAQGDYNEIEIEGHTYYIRS